MRPGTLLRWLLLLALLPTLAAAATTGLPLRGEWRPADGSAPWQAFDPQELTRITAGNHGADIRLWTVADAGDADDWVIAVHSGALDRLRWSDTAGEAVEAGLMDARRQDWLGYGRIGIPVDAWPSAARPLQLRLLPRQALGGMLAFALQPREVFLADEVRWVALVSVCLALLGGMALVALVFAARLRDRTFAWYAGYLASYTLIQLLQTGYAGSPLGWSWLLAAPQAWGRTAVMVSIVMIVLFLVRFADLRRFAPRTVRPVQAYAAAVALSGLLGWVPVDAVQAAARAAINPLLILGGPLLLAVGLRAWWRGSRYAGFFVVGWTPLLLVTGAGSLQMFGLFRGWLDEGQVPLLAAAFEAMVLSLGLADRIALVRRDRDLARALADTDPLTGVFNRRALEARWQQLCRVGGSAQMAVLYCDLDHFKRLNDKHGHAAGDHALRSVAAVLEDELRPGDVIGRMGGEEFVILLPRCGDAAALAVAERLCEHVRELGQPPRFGDDALTISIGVAVGSCSDAPELLLGRADRALYEAKAAGRDRVVLLPPDHAAGQVPSR